MAKKNQAILWMMGGERVWCDESYGCEFIYYNKVVCKFQDEDGDSVEINDEPENGWRLYNDEQNVAEEKPTPAPQYDADEVSLAVAYVLNYQNMQDSEYRIMANLNAAEVDRLKDCFRNQTRFISEKFGIDMGNVKQFYLKEEK